MQRSHSAGAIHNSPSTASFVSDEDFRTPANTVVPAIASWYPFVLPPTLWPVPACGARPPTFRARRTIHRRNRRPRRRLSPCPDGRTTAAARRDDGAVPEGDTVWLAAKRMHAALGGRRADPVRPAGAGAGHGRPHRGDRHRGAGPRQAPADPVRRRADPAHALPDGRHLAAAAARRALARRPGPPGPGGARERPTGRPSATGCTTSRWSRPPRRTGWSATSARTCSARTGTPPRRPPAARPTRTGRSATRCWTSGCWPASATSTRTRRCS